MAQYTTRPNLLNPVVKRSNPQPPLHYSSSLTSKHHPNSQAYVSPSSPTIINALTQPYQTLPLINIPTKHHSQLPLPISRQKRFKRPRLMEAILRPGLKWESMRETPGAIK